VTMTDHARPPVLELGLGKGGHQGGQFRVDRLFDQLASPIAQDVGEGVG